MGLLCPVGLGPVFAPMASLFRSLHATTPRTTLASSPARCIATSARVLARAAAGTAKKKYGKGAEPKKKKKLSPEAEVRLQVQTSKLKYDRNAYKMTLEDAINVIRVYAEST